MTTSFLLVAVGGALGACARYALSLLAASALGTLLPWGTLIVNVLGCACAGVMLHVLAPLATNDPKRLLVVVGFLGGLTTFSAFGIETLSLLRDGRVPAALANIALSVLLALAATWTGHALARATSP
jgi:CrcB protein